jgi:hypothetical protein
VVARYMIYVCLTTGECVSEEKRARGTAKRREPAGNVWTQVYVLAATRSLLCNRVPLSSLSLSSAVVVVVVVPEVWPLLACVRACFPLRVWFGPVELCCALAPNRVPLRDE